METKKTEMTVEQKAKAFDAIFKDFEVNLIKVRRLEARVRKLEQVILNGRVGKA